ncbi:MAG: cysteine synthase A [Proteobacteria bacterium]|nr:cysteine synthase A [Pseudomonadota bacterium]MDA1022006.1 cysteine synthase A [Pseudomonadota bacterium]
MNDKSTPATAPKAGFRGRIYDSIVDTIGATPLVRLSKLAADEGIKADLLAKCEFFNPLGSIKDRIGVSMIEAAERSGQISAGATLVEPTSGNTGIALAFVCAAKGYRLILTMPESMSEERRKMLAYMGAEIELTAAEMGMTGAVKRAEELVKQTPGAILLQQFKNPANPEIHRLTTAEEIWRDTGGRIDVLVCGVGTGGTLTGCAQVLKRYNPDISIIAIEPEDSPVLSGGMPGQHMIQGMGPGFIPDVLDQDIIDEILKIGTEPAFAMSRKIAKLEGIAVGMSSGANVAAAVEVSARPEMQDKTVVTFLPDNADRYLTTSLFDGFG